MRRRTKPEPREITVKYAAKCAETGRDLKPGDTAVYYPDGKKLYHPDSETARQFRDWRADQALGYDY